MSDSYYGRPVVKAHIWQWYVPAYFWIGGMAGASAIQTVAARAAGNDGLARISKGAAVAGIVLSPVLLIADLGRPERFANMLRVFKPSSPMSVGTWILTAFGGAISLAAVAELLGWRRVMVASELGGALLGAPLAVYTAVLVADTATPAWHEAYETLPFVFAAGSMSAAGAVATIFASGAERALAHRTMTWGAIALTASELVMEARLGALLAEPYSKGRPGALRSIARGCAVAGALIGLGSRAKTSAARIAAGFVIAGGVLERFAVLAAGTESANDPKYVVESQRARLEAAPPLAS